MLTKTTLTSLGLVGANFEEDGRSEANEDLRRFSERRDAILLAP